MKKPLPEGRGDKRFTTGTLVGCSEENAGLLVGGESEESGVGSRESGVRIALGSDSTEIFRLKLIAEQVGCGNLFVA